MRKLKPILNISTFLLMLTISNAVYALTFLLPVKGDVIGRWHYVTAKKYDTLSSIGKQWEVGYCEMAKANPHIKKGILTPGTAVLVPTKYILPDAPRKGIIINLPEHRLYYYFNEKGKKKVMTFPIAIGRKNWRTPELETQITMKKENPQWIVPAGIKQSALKRGKPLPDVVPPGPHNPLGERKMRLGHSAYLIHGTSNPKSIGKSESSGCIRMRNEHVKKLYAMVPIGTPVRIINVPYKVGINENGTLYVETHSPINDGQPKVISIKDLKLLLDKKSEKQGNSQYDKSRLSFVRTSKIGIPKRVSIKEKKVNTQTDF